MKAKDANTLIDSIRMDDLIKEPEQKEGAAGCLFFTGQKNTLTLCFDSNSNLVDQIIKAYKYFRGCFDGMKSSSTTEQQNAVAGQGGCQQNTVVTPLNNPPGSTNNVMQNQVEYVVKFKIN
jgi:hypothetical protein